MLDRLIRDSQLKMQIVSVACGNLAAIFNFAINILIARNLIVLDYGHYGALSALPQVFFSIFSFVPYALVKAMTVEHSVEKVRNIQIRTIFERYQILTFMWTVTLIVFSPFIARFFNIDSYFYIVALFLTLSFMNFLNFVSAFYQGRGLFAISGLKEVSLAGVKLGLLFVFFSAGYKSIWVPIFVELAATLIVLVPLWKMAKSPALVFFANCNQTFKQSLRWIYDSKGAIFSVFTMGIITSSDILLTKKFLTGDLAGIVIAGLSLSKTLIFFSGPVNMVLYFFSVKGKNGQSKFNVLLNSVLFTGFGVTFMGASMVWFKEPIVATLYGESYVELVAYLPYLLVHSGIISINLLLLNFLLSVHYVKVSVFVIGVYLGTFLYLHFLALKTEPFLLSAITVIKGLIVCSTLVAVSFIISLLIFYRISRHSPN